MSSYQINFDVFELSYGQIDEYTRICIDFKQYDFDFARLYRSRYLDFSYPLCYAIKVKDYKFVELFLQRINRYEIMFCGQVLGYCILYGSYELFINLWRRCDMSTKEIRWYFDRLLVYSVKSSNEKVTRFLLYQCPRIRNVTYVYESDVCEDEYYVDEPNPRNLQYNKNIKVIEIIEKYYFMNKQFDSINNIKLYIDNIQTSSHAELVKYNQ